MELRVSTLVLFIFTCNLIGITIENFCDAYKYSALSYLPNPPSFLSHWPGGRPVTVVVKH